MKRLFAWFILGIGFVALSTCFVLWMEEAALERELDSQVARIAESGAPYVKYDDDGRVVEIITWPAEVPPIDPFLLCRLPELRVLELGRRGIVDAHLSFLKDMPRLEMLHLTTNNVTDASIADIAKAPKLMAVDLRNTNVTHLGLKRLRQARPDLKLAFDHDVIPGVANLQLLRAPFTVDHDLEVDAVDASGIEFHDADVAKVLCFSRLKMLNLSRTSIGDEGVSQLGTLTELRELWLASTNVSDSSVPVIVQLPNLRSVSFRGTRITNEGLALLSQRRTLREVDVRETAITDAGVRHLHSLPELESIWLISTEVTSDAVQQLQFKVPHAKIHFGKRTEGVEPEDIESRIEYG